MNSIVLVNDFSFYAFILYPVLKIHEIPIRQSIKNTKVIPRLTNIFTSAMP